MKEALKAFLDDKGISCPNMFLKQLSECAYIQDSLIVFDETLTDELKEMIAPKFQKVIDLLISSEITLSLTHEEEDLYAEIQDIQKEFDSLVDMTLENILSKNEEELQNIKHIEESIERLYNVINTIDDPTLVEKILADIKYLKERLNSFQETHTKEKEEIKRSIFIDDMTGFLNKTFANRFLGTSMEHFKRDKDIEEWNNWIELINQNPTLLNCDLINFKKINDVLGHDIGDEVLERFGNLVHASDIPIIPIRNGGDEFIFLSTKENIQQLKELFEESNFVEALNKDLSERTHVSYGETTLPSFSPAQDNDTIKESKYLISQRVKESDENMYEHKKKKKLALKIQAYR